MLLGVAITWYALDLCSDCSRSEVELTLPDTCSRMGASLKNDLNSHS
jgi:hypothetical protein